MAGFQKGKDLFGGILKNVNEKSNILVVIEKKKKWITLIAYLFVEKKNFFPKKAIYNVWQNGN